MDTELSEKAKPEQEDEERMHLSDLLDSRWAFGPGFFLGQLAGFVRDCCPDPSEGLPAVRLHLIDGSALDVCHIIGVAPTWLAVAVIESERPSGAPPMRTELIPYGMVARVSIRSEQHEGFHIGFDVARRPDVVPHDHPPGARTPEETLAAVARSGPKGGGAGLSRVGDKEREAPNRKGRGVA